MSSVSLAVLGALSSCTTQSDDLPLSSGTAVGGAVADAMLNKAKAYESAGKTSKAISTYGNIAKKYPNANSAAEARYSEGRLLDKQGDLFKSFEAYQELITRYPSSKHYAQALKRQESVAHAAANGIIKNNFLGMKTSISPEKTSKMLGHVRDNAPRALSASKAQFAIGQVWQKEGIAEKAIPAFQRIGADYPNSKESPEALYLTGEILILKAERGNQNKANVNRAKSIFQDLVQRYPSHSRAADARKRLSMLGGQDLQRSYDTAEFYRKKGQPKSALFYYREVLRKTKSGPLHNQAKQRITELGG